MDEKVFWVLQEKTFVETMAAQGFDKACTTFLFILIFIARLEVDRQLLHEEVMKGEAISRKFIISFSSFLVSTLGVPPISSTIYNAIFCQLINYLGTYPAHRGA